ncbi:MAG: hypothetical protein DDT31_01245 [Syntrophomonadaceae bacterium]|nr:hypothetical protein [Bacillota bacterium]MBT9138671.1 hypothetical protein [Bacillota bacterium]MBT9148562.1 hypothetical protein [Bacillota bacterium]
MVMFKENRRKKGEKGTGYFFNVKDRHKQCRELLED